ncbi:MAG: PAS domain S-box protein, partial [Balneolales bacterium]|nr:PAS domain S-box protein [Balneolales bacterium]
SIDSYSAINDHISQVFPFCICKQVKDQNEFEKEFFRSNPDIIIADDSIPGFPVLDAFHFVRSYKKAIPFIVLAHNRDESLSPYFVIKNGVTDHIKMTDTNRLLMCLANEIRHMKTTYEKKLKNEYKVLQSLVASHTNDGILITNAKGYIEWVNSAFTSTYGFSADELIGQKPGDVLQGSDTNPETVNFIREKLQEEVPFSCDIKNYSKDGTPYWINLNIFPYFQDGVLKRFFSIQQDVTEQRLAKKEIRESLDRLKEAHLIGKIADWEFNPVTQKINWADQFSIMCEYPPDAKPDFLKIMEMIKQPSRDILYNAINTAIEEQKPYDLHFDLKTKSGVEKVFRTIGVPIIEEGQVALLKGVVQDVTEQRLAERAAKSSQEQLEALSNNVKAGVTRYVIDKNNRVSVKYANPGVFEFFEFTSSQVKEDISTIWNQIYEEDTVRTAESIRERSGMNPIIDDVFRIITPSGKLKWIHSICKTSISSNGEIYCDVLYIDVTETKRKEQLFEEVSEVSKVGGWEYDVLRHKLAWTPVTYQIHGMDLNEEIGVEMAIKFYARGYSRNKVTEVFNMLIKEGKSYDERLQIVTASGKLKWVRTKGECEIADGKVVRCYGTFQDIDNIVTNETKIVESLNEKNALLGEIHHRVKNNLAIVSGLLQLQLMKGNLNEKSLEDAVHRIQSIGAVHELLYKTDNFNVIDIKEYLNKLTGQISKTFPKLGESVQINLKVDAEELNINLAVPLGLMLNELITNSVKHAFNDDKEGIISIKLTPLKKSLELVYRDNG